MRTSDMTEPRFRIRAKQDGRPDRWLAFDPSRTAPTVLVDHPSNAYAASRSSMEIIVKRRGGAFGRAQLVIEEAL